MGDRILVEGLRAMSYIGVPESERAVAQEVVIDLDVGIDLTEAGEGDAFEATIDYARLVAEVEEVAGSGSRALLERLAHDIAAHISATFPVRRVTVKVAKASPPVPQRVDVIAIEIERADL